MEHLYVEYLMSMSMLLQHCNIVILQYCNVELIAITIYHYVTERVPKSVLGPILVVVVTR